MASDSRNLQDLELIHIASFGRAISLDGLEQLLEGGKKEELWKQGQKWWHKGLFENGQRHDAVIAVGHYLWYGDPANNVPAYPEKYDRARARLIEAWLEKNHNGHCRHINEGRWDVVRDQIQRATSWRREKKEVVREAYYLSHRLLKRLIEVYKTTGQVWEISRLEAANNTREAIARAKLERATQYCLAEGIQITRNGLAQISGCSPNTVSKHKDIWECFLTTGSGVYITWGVRGGLEGPGSDLGPEEKKENFENPSVRESDTSGLGDRSEVASLLSYLAEEPTTRPQSKDLGLEAGQVFTPGPWLRGIQSGTAGAQGGIVLCFSLRLLGETQAGEMAPGGPRRDIESAGGAVNDRPGNELRLLATPHKPDNGGVLVSGSGCTHWLDKGLEIFHCRYSRGPPAM